MDADRTALIEAFLTEQMALLILMERARRLNVTEVNGLDFALMTVIDAVRGLRSGQMTLIEGMREYQKATDAELECQGAVNFPRGWEMVSGMNGETQP